jgi:glycosyltransferase involved in cell wall biosynthesis
VELLLLAGEAPEKDPGFPFTLVEALSYDRPGQFPAEHAAPAENAASASAEKRAEALALAILRAMEERWGEAADVVHVHNPLIQKNRLLIPALKILLGRGIRLFLQNHDLAEDFRPDVYMGGAEYPENCHYGVINSRDYFYLHHAGLRGEGLHLIPNEVSPLKALPSPERIRYLYPVRAIRRKNIGEALLLSVFIPSGRTVAFTLPPSEKDAAHYRRWVDFAAELGLPVEFELGLKYSLPELLGSAVCALSTSVKEGFGFSFLEPWTAGRGLVGRRIDYVCRDFEEDGLRFDGLYSSLEIPSDYIFTGGLRKKMEDAMKGIYRSFGMEAPPHLKQMITDDLGDRSSVDFGRLDEEIQESIIRVIDANPTVRRDVVRANPFLERLGDYEADEGLIEANRKVIAEKYGRERIVKILLEIYRSVMEDPVKQKILKPTLLDLYLDPLRLSLVGMSYG